MISKITFDITRKPQCFRPLLRDSFPKANKQKRQYLRPLLRASACRMAAFGRQCENVCNVSKTGDDRSPHVCYVCTDRHR